MKISPEYIAGFIDGEAYLGIYLTPNKKTYITAVKVAQTAQGYEVLEYLREIYGGHIDTRTSKQPNHQDSKTWVIKSKKGILKLLEDILPFLIVKREQAELMKEYCELPILHPLYTDPKKIARGKEIAEQMLRLKRPLATTE